MVAVTAGLLVHLDEILTVIRLGLPPELRRSLACTNIIENALGTVRTVQRNVKRWHNAETALRWTAAGLLEAKKTFRRLKAYRQLPLLKAALKEHMTRAKKKSAVETIEDSRIASIPDDACLAFFNKGWDIASSCSESCLRQIR